MQDRVEAAQVANRSEEAGGVLQESNERAEGESVAQDLAAAVPEDQRGGERPDELDDRREGGFVDDRLELRLPVVPVDPLELPLVLLLPPEQLHQEHPRDRLLQEGVQTGNALPDVAVGLSDPPAQQRRQQEENRGDREGGQGQAKIQPAEDHHNRHELQAVAQERNHPR